MYQPVVLVKRISNPTPTKSAKKAGKNSSPNAPPPPPDTVCLVKCLMDSSLHTVSDISALPTANSLDLSAVSDIMSLPKVTEPSLLHTLRSRYSKDKAYTGVGQVLVSINPYKWNKNDYCNRLMFNYHNAADKVRLAEAAAAVRQRAARGQRSSTQLIFYFLPLLQTRNCKTRRCTPNPTRTTPPRPLARRRSCPRTSLRLQRMPFATWCRRLALLLLPEARWNRTPTNP